MTKHEWKEEKDRYESVASFDCARCGLELEPAVDGGPNEYWCTRCSRRHIETSGALDVATDGGGERR